MYLQDAPAKKDTKEVKKNWNCYWKPYKWWFSEYIMNKKMFINLLFKNHALFKLLFFSP